MLNVLIVLAILIVIVIYLSWADKKAKKREQEQDDMRRKEEGVIIQYSKVLGLDPGCYFEVHHITGRKILQDAGILEIFQGLKISPCYHNIETEFFERIKLRCAIHKIPLTLIRGDDLIPW